MRNFGLEVGRQIDDGNGAERAFLGADTASNTQALREKGDSRVWRHFDTQLAAAHHRTRLLALLTTFLGLALVAVDDGDTGRQLLAHRYPSFPR